MINTTNGSQEIWSAERVKELTMSKIAKKSNIHDLEQRQRKRPLIKTAVSFATAAAVICFMVLGGTILFPKDSNVFELKAFAIQQLADGSIEQREIDLVNEAYGWSFNDNGENVYINIWLKCDGENIERVDFYVDEGFFATQNIRRENGQVVTEGIPMAGRDSTITQYGSDYANVGSHFTLRADEISEDLLIFWGTESRRVGNDLNLPSELTIHAVATFNDGKTHEEILALDLSLSEMQGFGSFALTDEEIEQRRAEVLRFDEFLHGIPLDQCEIVPGSEIILTYGDTFMYEIVSSSGFGGTAMHIITEESMNPASVRGLEQDGFKGPFDDNGVMRFGASQNLFNLWNEYDGNDGYIAAIEANGDGTFTAMTYKIPGWLILEYMD